ncbi:MAG: hypothetical protein IPO83_14555 [Chitinophagaceae bacterium]|nr:hypothetical protein [Chitinophagaceae bacterium]
MEKIKSLTRDIGLSKLDSQFIPIFDELAVILILETQLCIGRENIEKWNLAEIEFYFKGDQIHQDDYCHCHPRQLLHGKWYFHRNLSGNYKSPNRMGMDLCLGNGKNHFGILIRAITNTEYIYGPSLIANHVQEITNKAYSDLEELNVFENQILYLQDRQYQPEPIFQSFRVGLSKKNLQFKNAPYRYFVLPRKKHTDKEKIALSWIKEEIYSIEKVLSIFGWKTLPKSIGELAGN